jgi:hypothetical protein
MVPNAADNPFPDVHPMHAARLLERLEGYKVPVVTEATPVQWVYDADRNSQLQVRRGGKIEVLAPFHSAVSAAGWGGPRSMRAGNDGAAALAGPAAPRWPQRASLPKLPQQVPDGATLRLGDSLYPEALRDLVAYAHLLARRL